MRAPGTSEAPASCRSAGQDRRPYGTAPPTPMVWAKTAKPRSASHYPTHRDRGLSFVFECCRFAPGADIFVAAVGQHKDPA